MSFSALVLSKIKYLSSHQRLHQSNKLMSKKKEEKRRKKKKKEGTVIYKEKYFC